MTTRRLLSIAALACLLAPQVAVAAPLTADERKCSDAVNKGGRNVGNQEQKKNRKCVKDGSGDINTCVSTESPKAAIKRTKLEDLYDSGAKCDPVPPYGVNSDPDAIADTVEADAGNILEAVWGDPVDGVPAASKCADKIAKRAGKKFDTIMKTFRKCAKKLPAINDLADLELCVGSAMVDAKVTKTQEKLDNDVAKQCPTPPNPPNTDGPDAACDAESGTQAEYSACIGTHVNCEACRAINKTIAGNADCDLLDNGAVDGTCPCPLDAGTYTMTQVSGGFLAVDGITPFPFPSGGSVVMDVGPATAPACVHSAVVPYPGGFSAPAFCIPVLNYSVRITQTGCGIGAIDSNGGSDFTISELGDTSSPVVCALPQPGCALGANSSLQADVTVGDSVTDTCSSGGRGNVILTIPVFTETWSHLPVSDGCPDPDGMPGGMGDMPVVNFNQILDFTTDTTSADWSDLDPDGCCLAGIGPASTSPCHPVGTSGLTYTGTCLNLSAGTVGTAASGPVGSSGAPLFDITFANQLPNSLTGPAPSLGAVCASPPLINLGGGTVTRCLP